MSSTQSSETIEEHESKASSSTAQKEQIDEESQLETKVDSNVQQPKSIIDLKEVVNLLWKQMPKSQHHHKKIYSFDNKVSLQGYPGSYISIS